MDMDKQFIRDIKKGGAVASIFSLKYRHPVREYKNGFMFLVGLADSTGEIEATYWGGPDREKVQEVYNSISENCVVRVEGIAGVFRDKLKIDIDESAGGIKPIEDYDIGLFVPRTEKNAEEMKSALINFKNGVRNEYLQRLLESFFGDAEFMSEFEKAPAAMYIHHAYIGGLMEHTLNVASTCARVAEEYQGLDRDLLITGALLHDIGKTREFAVTTNIGISEEGMLRGHITIGEEMVGKQIELLPDFPEALRFKMLHIILSHHGKSEYGSPREPMIPEAAVIYYADEMDAKAYQYIKTREEADTEDFHIYSKRLGQIYLK